MSSNALCAVLLFALLAAAEWALKGPFLVHLVWPPTYTATAKIELRRPPCPSFPYPIIWTLDCPGEPVPGASTLQ